MFKKSMTMMMMAIALVFAQNLETQQVEEVKPFIFEVSSSETNAKNLNSTTNFHISLFSGRVKSVQGLQLGLISNYVTDDFIGYDGTLIYSKVNGNYAGLQSVGIASEVMGNYTGIQENGIYSYVGGDFLGIQTTGLINKVEGSLKGIQISGIINKTRNVTGGQITGIVNEAEDVEGVQITGIVNKAKDITGAQISGIVNKADHVKGVQIGLVNRSKKLDGIAIGLVNLSEEGSVHAIGWAGGTCDYSAGIKFAPNDYWYTIISFGDIQDSDEMGNVHVFESRMGLHYQLLDKLYIEADLGSGVALSYNLDNWEDEDQTWGIFDARVALGLKLGKRLSVFGGVSQSFIGQGENWDDDPTTETKPFFGIQF